jgi:TRAP-type mannitol/chloroaromatic compound transport system substrate-binding protein
MAKRLLVCLVAVIAVAGLLIAGCAAEEAAPEEEAPEEEAAPEEEEEEEEAPAAPEAEVYNWVAQGALPSGMPVHEGLTRLAESIKVASNGQLIMEAKPAGAVVPATEEWKAVDRGVLDFCAGGGSYMAADVRFGTALSQLPAGMPPLPNLIFQKMVATDLVDEWYEKRGYNMMDLPCGLPGLPEGWIHLDKKLEDPDDLKGLKMRASGDGGEILAAMGVGTVFMPLGEIFESMHRGVIDAFECSCPAFDWSMGLQEVGEYYYLSPTRAPTEVYQWLVNKDSFAELPDHLKQVLEDCCLAEGIKYHEMLHGRNAKAIQDFKDYGVIVETLPASIDEAFVEQTKAYYKAEVEEHPELKDYLEAYFEFARNWEELYGFPTAVMTSFD